MHRLSRLHVPHDQHLSRQCTLQQISCWLVPRIHFITCTRPCTCSAPQDYIQRLMAEKADLDKRFHGMKDELITRLQNACAQRDEARAQVRAPCFAACGLAGFVCATCWCGLVLGGLLPCGMKIALRMLWLSAA